MKSLDAFDTFTALNHVKGKDVVKNIYSDNFPSLKKATREIKATWEPSLPGVHHSNAVIERCNQEIQ